MNQKLSQLRTLDSTIAYPFFMAFFDYASKNSSAKSEILGVEITIKPDSSNNLLGCSFYKN